jgi:hypothetical protein
MEPAVKQRKYSTGTVRPFTYVGWPQWSPPLSRSRTPLDDPVGHQGVGAAMEPTVNRREYLVLLAEQVGDFPATMEPAGGRREHPDRNCWVSVGIQAAMGPAAD